MTGKADAVRAVSQQFNDQMNTVIEGVMAHLRHDTAAGRQLAQALGRAEIEPLSWTSVG